MQVTERETGRNVIISISGKFVFDSRKGFQEALKRAKEKKPRKIVLNVEDLTYIDSAGLGLLAVGFEQAKIENIDYCFVNPNGTVRRILDMTKLPQIVSVFDSEEQALGSPGPSLMAQAT